MVVSQAIKQFKKDSRTQQFRVLALIAVSLGLVAVAQRDIQRRPADQVRGSKLLWRLICLNALGALSYFRWGRRTTENGSGRLSPVSPAHRHDDFRLL